jgi:hypothetical protein
MDSQDLYAFLSDAKLVDLIERVKRSDDFMDIISLSEPQHSDMLAWCLHPNEGHGQGDAVVKDFLIAAYHAGVSTNRFANGRFFSEWTPGRIRTSSFGSAFIAREFSLGGEEAGRGNSQRLDLFLIDPVNRIVVTIENKVRAPLTENQLNGYHKHVDEQLRQRPMFKDYAFAFVVVDKRLETYTDEDTLALGNRWALLDYGWLKASANRARLHMERNNQAAQMLMAYCEKQTGWQSPNEELVSELAAGLASQHEPVIEKIRELGRIKPTHWTPKSFDDADGELLLFIQQNRQLCSHLVQARGIGAVVRGLRKSMPTLGHEDIEQGRTWVRFATPGMQALMHGDDDYWPIWVNVFRETKSDDESSRFTVRFVWVAENFSDGCDEGSLRRSLAQRFPELKKFEKSAYRRVVVNSKLNATDAVTEAVELAMQIDEILRLTCKPSM